MITHPYMGRCASLNQNSLDSFYTPYNVTMSTALKPPNTQTLKPTVYAGTFVHCISLTALEISEHGAIGVDAEGKISFVERNVPNIEQILAKHGWSTYEIVHVPAEGFFFPGFIGRCLSHPLLVAFVASISLSQLERFLQTVMAHWEWAATSYIWIL